MRARAVAQVLGVAVDDVLELRTQQVLVEVEVDDARAQAGIGVEVGRRVAARGVVDDAAGGGAGVHRGFGGTSLTFLLQPATATTRRRRRWPFAVHCSWKFLFHF
jgi:hypothetical protein